MHVSLVSANCSIKDIQACDAGRMGDMELFANLTAQQREALKRIVGDWVGEGFTSEPYEDAYYDIFESLGLANDNGDYDTRRPS